MSVGKQLKNRLKDYNLTYNWLISELYKKGVATDKTEISAVFAGTRKGQKVETILNTTRDILNEYEQKFLC